MNFLKLEFRMVCPFVCFLKYTLEYLFLLLLTKAGTQAGEEIPVVSRTNIKEYKDSFSNEKFDFRNNPNITFFVYVSNFTWPIKIQVRAANICRIVQRSVSCFSQNCGSLLCLE